MSDHVEKVFRKLKFQVHPNDIQAVINVSPGAVERVLFFIYGHIRRGNQIREELQTTQTTQRTNAREEQGAGYMQQLALK